MLARVAAVLQQRRAMGLPIHVPAGIVMGTDGEGDAVQVAEDCVVSASSSVERIVAKDVC